MPFGLTKVLVTFNRLMEKLFFKHSAYASVFFDDIIVHSQTLEEHKLYLQSIFDEVCLYVNGKKSKFFMLEIKNLCHIISKDGIEMDLDNLRVIKEWPKPRNVHEVWSFLGMCSYYQHFIAHFSSITRPLHDLKKKKMSFVWTPREK